MFFYCFGIIFLLFSILWIITLILCGAMRSIVIKRGVSRILIGEFTIMAFNLLVKDKIAIYYIINNCLIIYILSGLFMTIIAFRNDWWD